MKIGNCLSFQSCPSTFCRSSHHWCMLCQLFWWLKFSHSGCMICPPSGWLILSHPGCMISTPRMPDPLTPWRNDCSLPSWFPFANGWLNSADQNGELDFDSSATSKWRIWLWLLSWSKMASTQTVFHLGYWSSTKCFQLSELWSGSCSSQLSSKFGLLVCHLDTV